MPPVDCEFESEVLAAVVQSRWPDRVDPGLRAHAVNCAICSDVAAVAAAIDEVAPIPIQTPAQSKRGLSRRLC